MYNLHVLCPYSSCTHVDDVLLSPSVFQHPFFPRLSLPFLPSAFVLSLTRKVNTLVIELKYKDKQKKYKKCLSAVAQSLVAR